MSKRPVYKVYDYNPRLGVFYVTCTTNMPEVAASWFKFNDPANEDYWKYVTRE